MMIITTTTKFKAKNISTGWILKVWKHPCGKISHIMKRTADAQVLPVLSYIFSCQMRILSIIAWLKRLFTAESF
jgi:hypothetical protein